MYHIVCVCTILFVYVLYSLCCCTCPDTLPDVDKFQFDTVWGGIINNKNAFGFKMYSDHHFHFGYWLYAIAYYAKFFPAWAMGK